jgi:hypothetical protein
VLARFDDVAPPADSTAQAELRQRIGEVDVNYRPMLFAPRGMISVFSAQALRLDEANAIHHGVAAYPLNDPPVAFEIDRTVLERAIVHLRRMVQRSERALVSVPLRLQSLIEHSGGQLVDRCRAQPPIVRRHLVIDIFSLLTDAPTARLGEAVAALHPFCRSVTATLPTGFADLERVARLGLSSVGLELQMPDQAGPPPPLAAFARAAHAQGLTAHIHGIAGSATLEAARAAGFDYLDGAAVTGAVARPTAMYSYRGAP